MSTSDKMRIYKLPLDEHHWSTNWIPISYTNMISPRSYTNSSTYLWYTNQNRGKMVNAICRAYKISSERVEIGDVWLAEQFRGKKINNGSEKISYVFMKRVLKRIWKDYKGISKITLLVSKNNIPAVKLYEKLGFEFMKKAEEVGYLFGVKKAIYMILRK